MQSITTQTRLGFLGLGYLGSRIARRLVAAGFPMTVWDRSPKRRAEFLGLGVRVAPSIAGLANDVDVVLSCLADDAAVEDVYFGEGGVLGTKGSYSTIIELSTVAPETSRRVHDAGEQLGVAVLDVAISGSTRAAES